MVLYLPVILEQTVSARSHGRQIDVVRWYGPHAPIHLEHMVVLLDLRHPGINFLN